MPFQDEIYRIADELRSIANWGTYYVQNDYDRERYKHALSLSAPLVAAIEERSGDEVMEEYKGDPTHVTPYVSADAVVFLDGRILLIKREDNGLWAMPGGATEVGETWAQSVSRKLHEEAGGGRAMQLLSVFRLPSLGQ